MKIKEITAIIEDYAPICYQEDYDNSGLIVGSFEDEVKGILISLDSTEEVIDEAIKKQCELVIVHHPIIFSGIKQLNGKNYIERTIIKAIKNNISIYACHTNLDNVFNGVSFKIAEKLGLKNCRVLVPKKNKLKKLVIYCPTESVDKVRKALFNSGAGNIGGYSECSFNSLGQGTFKSGDNTNPVVGNIGEFHVEEEIKIETIVLSHEVNKVISAMKEAHPYEEVAYDIYNLDNYHEKVGSGVIGELKIEENEMSFLKRLKKTLNTDCVRYTSLLDKQVKRVAICGGSGSFLLTEAKKQNADVFITADFKYHQFFDAENQIIVADIGHYESEQFTL